MRRSLIARVASRTTMTTTTKHRNVLSMPSSNDEYITFEQLRDLTGRWNRYIPKRSFWSLLQPLSSSSSLSSSQNNADQDVHSDKTDMIQMPSRQDFTRPRDCDRTIVRLLDCPNDALLDSATWIRAQAYVQQALDDGDFHLAFELLDRMAKDPHANKVMNSQTIYLVVEYWLAAYGRYQRSGKGEFKFTQYMYTPITVWRKIENYLHCGIPMESRTLHRIIESSALVKSKKFNAPMLAENILDTMLDLSRHQSPEIRPSCYTFNAVIGAWEAAATSIKSPKSFQEAPERGLKLLERLKALHAAGWGDDLMPDRNTYRRVMNLYAHNGDGDQVEALLEELYEWYLEYGHKSLVPTTPLFSLVLYAWSKSKDPTATERATTILNRMLEMEQNKELPGFKVTAFCFNIVMVCWSKQKTRESAQKAQDLYDEMVALSANDPSKLPIPGSYAALVHNWSYWDPKRAEEVFWEWKRQHNLGNCDMRMDSRLFSSLIAGWFYSKEPSSAKRCDKLLQYALEGNFGDAWEPNVAVFNMTINAFCRTKNAKGVERAEELLVQMKTLAKSDRKFPPPSLSSYAPVIHALTRLGRVEKAEQLLHECFESNKTNLGKENDAAQHPTSKGKHLNTKTFNRVLKAWLAKTPVRPEAADRAENLLLKMNEWGVKPNIASFKYVLECRKRARNRQEGLEQSHDLSSRAKRILALLDSEYETGELNADKSSYLSTRRDWALISV